MKIFLSLFLVCLFLVFLYACEPTPSYPEMTTEWMPLAESGLEEIRYLYLIPETNALLAGGFPRRDLPGLSVYNPIEKTWAIITDDTPVNQQVSWIASAGEAIFVSFFAGIDNKGTILASHDSGKTFDDVIPLPDDIDPRCFVLPDDNPASMLLGTVNDGLFLTDDGGETWRQPQTPTADPGIQSLAVNSGNSNHILVGVRTGLWKSMDQGENWVSITPRLLSDQYFVVEVTAHPNKENVFTCILRDDMGDAYLYMTKDGGVSWYEIRDGFHADAQPRCITWHPANPEVMFAGTVIDGVYRSDNLGQNWYPINKGLPLENALIIVHRLFPVNDPTLRLYAGLNIHGQVLKLDIQ